MTFHKCSMPVSAAVLLVGNARYGFPIWRHTLASELAARTRGDASPERAGWGGAAKLWRRARRAALPAFSLGSARSSWMRELIASLVNTLRRWYSTVPGLMNSCGRRASGTGARR
jgi:hypothetical protein